MKKRVITLLPALILALACMWVIPAFAEEKTETTEPDVILSDDASDFVQSQLERTVK